MSSSIQTDKPVSIEQLQETVERLTVALEAADVGIWDWDLRSGRVVWNATNARLYGTTLEEFDGSLEGFKRCVHPDDLEGVMNTARDSMAQAKEFCVEHRVVWADGSIHWLSARGRYFYDERGNPVRMGGMVTDVTERRRIEEALHRSEQFNRSIIEASKDCIKVLDREGNLLFMSAGGQRSLGVRDIGPFLNKSWVNLMEGENRTNAAAAVAAAAAGKVGTFQAFLPTLQGEPRWWDVIITAIAGPDGRPERLLAISRDITARRKVEEALQASETRYRFFVESIPQLVWSGDPSFTEIDCNSRWHEYTGQAVETVCEFGWLDMIHPDDRSRTLQAWTEANARGGRYEVEYRLRRHCDGAYRWFLAQGLPMTDGQGTIVRWFGTCTDIDDRKRTEEALRATEERFRLVLENSLDIVYCYDLQARRYLYSSPVAEQINGFTVQEIQAMKFEDVIARVHPADVELWRREVERIAGGGRATITYRFQCKSGEYRWMENRIAVILDSRGEPKYRVGVARDVTDRRRDEEKLAVAEQRFRSFVRHVQDVIFRYELLPHRHYSYISPSVEQLTGYPPEDWYADPEIVHRIVHPEDRPKLELYAETPTEPGTTVQFTHRNGRLMWVEQRVVAVRDDDGRVVALEGAVRDITERKLAEERERTLRAELTHVARLGTAGQMAAGIAHELNQPLAAIVNYIGACQEMARCGRLDQSQVLDVLESVSAESHRAAEIIRRLRAFVRKQEPRHGPMDLNTLMHEAVSLLRAELSQRRVEVVWDVAPNLPAARGDPVQIVQVLVNLISNAIDAMDAPGLPERTLVLQAACAASPGRLNVRVIDRGCGLSAAVRERIFEEFFTTKRSGLGLGLPISRSIIETHGGHLVARPNPRGGAIFEFDLPGA